MLAFLTDTRVDLGHTDLKKFLNGRLDLCLVGFTANDELEAVVVLEISNLFCSNTALL